MQLFMILFFMSLHGKSQMTTGIKVDLNGVYPYPYPMVYMEHMQRVCYTLKLVTMVKITIISYYIYY